MDDTDKNFDLPNLPSKAAADVALAAIGGTSDGVRGTAVDVWGGLVGDRIKEWRKRNLVNSLEKTAVHLSEKGVDLAKARHLPEGELYRIFEGSSKAEEPSLNEMWARLLASSMDPNNAIKADEALTKILEQLAPNDAKLFLTILRSERLAHQADKLFDADFRRLTNTLARAEKDHERGLISFFMRTDIEQAVWRENAEFLTQLKEKHAELAEKLEADISALKEVNSSRSNLLRLGLIERRAASTQIPDFYLDGNPDDVDILSFEYKQSLEAMKEWMHNIYEKVSDEGEFRTLELGDNKIALNYRISHFGVMFADACVD